MDYDAELELHNRILRQAYDMSRHDRVLDIGCGTGQTTRDAARLASNGVAHGVDSSARMIERARNLSQAEGLHNVTYQHDDAESCRFAKAPFDLAISRFGTMFFTDPIAAFANIRRHLRPGARLVMMVWQGHERNEWSVSIERSLVGSENASLGSRPTSGPFSLADPASVEQILDSAGFGAATFSDVHQPVYYGPDVATAFDFVSGFQSTNDMLIRLDPASREGAVDRLRRVLAAHETKQGVWFDSRSWIVTARRR